MLVGQEAADFLRNWHGRPHAKVHVHTMQRTQSLVTTTFGIVLC